MSPERVLPEPTPAPVSLRRLVPPLLSSGSPQDKMVRFGSVESAHITLAKQCILPAIVVTMLAVSMVAFRQPLQSQFYALGLVSFLIAAQIFTPLKLQRVPVDGVFGVLSRLALEWTCVVAILVFMCVSFKLTHVFARDALICWSLITPFILWCAELLCLPIARRLGIDRAVPRGFLIIGANDVGLELARRIEQNTNSGKFFGFFDYRQSDRLAELAHQPVTAGCKASDYAEFVRRNSIDRVYIALPMSTAPRIQELLSELRDTTASVYFVPNLFAFDLVQARCVEINGMPAFSICDSPLQGMSAIWKRMLDVSLATLALLLLWPVLSAVAVGITISSPGPILFKQRRYGLNGEEILIYKFRSMTVCEDGPVIVQATRQDRRITRFGALLRRTSLDELPQLLNVLEGKMSFVGPRPHAIAHNEEYRKLISGYMIRHKVRPGMTGWAQVNGLRGETSTIDQMHDRVQYDLDYLKNWSLGLDLKIIFRTAWTLLNDSKAY
ncbi:MAG: undecaprenyl-phosphate glucose phosphotransferase [Pseudomonadota bacterium]|nr:undecaprenyl-phosphate glucose phosphotransferase [Pseudomonadota bacterium]